MATNSIGKDNVLIAVAVPKDLLKRLDELVKASKVSRSEYIRGIIEQAQKNNLIVSSQKVYTLREKTLMKIGKEWEKEHAEDNPFRIIPSEPSKVAETGPVMESG